MAYKVVNINLLSARADYDSPIELRVQYIRDTYVKGPYPLFVFRKKADAIKWARCFCSSRLFLCRTKGLRDAPKRILSLSHALHIYLGDFWRTLKTGVYSTWPTPEGTAIADEVMLTKEVTVE